MKSYIFVFNGGATEREKLIDVLNVIPEVYTWRYDMGSCFYILSDSTAQKISETILASYPTLGRHVITKLGDEYWGNLTSNSWHMLQNCELPPESNK
jgi:hypothetical protein